MKLVWLTAVALSLCCIAGAGATPMQRWESANRTAIAKIHTPPARAAAQRAFEATLARIAKPGPTVASSAAQRSLAVAELAIPGRYDLREGTVGAPPQTPWDRFWAWVGKWWNKLMEAIFGRQGVSGSTATVLGDLLIVLAGGTLIFVLFRFMVLTQIDRSGRGGAFTPLDARKDAHALYMQACALAQAGSYDAAVQRLFLAAVTALDLRGVLRDNPSATVGDMRRVLRARNYGLVSPFDDIAAPFVDATYAETPIDATYWERAKVAYARLTASEVTA